MQRRRFGCGLLGHGTGHAIGPGGTRALLWGRNPAHMDAMKVAGCNQRFLPDIRFPDGLELEADLENAVRSTDEVLIVVPSPAFVEVVSQIEPWLRRPGNFMGL